MERNEMRDHRIDNIKAFLIFFVIFGHFLELFPNGGTLYRIIYSFHMPTFIFISGYFAKFDRKKIMSALVYPYVLFQILYLFFDALVIKEDIASFALQFTTPYWLLWYLLAMALYHLTLPFVDGVDSRIVFVLACALSITAGFDSTIGYYLTLSRFFTFLPYFFLGVMLGRIDIGHLLKNKAFRFVTAVVALVACYLLHKQGLVNNAALYGSYSYAAGDYSFVVRLLLLLAGINWIFFFLWFFPQHKLPLISSIGKYTLIPFLLHGFLKKYLEHRGSFFVYSTYVNMGIAVLLSLIILLIFGNQYVGSALRLFFTGEGIHRIRRKISTGQKKRQVAISR